VVEEHVLHYGQLALGTFGVDFLRAEPLVANRVAALIARYPFAVGAARSPL